MPSVSSKQKRFMDAAAADKKFADKVGIKQSVAKEFVEADRSVEPLKKSRLDKLYKGNK